MSYNNWFGLKDGSCEVVEGGFPAIFWWWVKIANVVLCLGLVVIAAIVFVAFTQAEPWMPFVAALAVFVAGLVSLVASNWMGWKLIPVLGDRRLLFHKEETGYHVLRSREGEVIEVYEEHFKLFGKIYWNGCAYKWDKPYRCKEDLSGEMKDPHFISVKRQQRDLAGEAETKDADVRFRVLVWFHIERDQIKEVVTGLEGIFLKTLDGVIMGGFQDALINMRTAEARALTSSDEFERVRARLDPKGDPPGKPMFIRPDAVSEELWPETDWGTVAAILNGLEGRLMDEAFASLENWDIVSVKTTDGQLEKAFARQTVATHARAAADLEGEAERAKVEPRWEAWQEKFPGDTTGKYLDGRTGAALTLNETRNETREDRRTTVDLGQVAEAATAVATAIGNTGGGNDDGNGNQSDPGRQPRQRRRGRRDRVPPQGGN